MKINSRESKAQFSIATFGLLLLLCAISPHRAVAQTNTFPASGNAGVGTTTPAAKLEVSGDNPLPRVTNTNTASYGGLELFEGGTIKFGLHTLGSASGSSYVGGANGVQFWNYANGPMVFGTNSIERMRIDTNGNVGLGTTDIEGWTQATSVLESLNTSLFFGQVGDLHSLSNAYHQNGWKYKSTGLAADYYLYNGTHAWRVAPAGTVDTAISWKDAMTISNSGNVGIGTTSPSSKLHIVSGTDNSASLLHLDTGVHGGTQMVVYGTANNESGYDLSVYRGGEYISRFGVSNFGNVYLQAGGGSVGIGTVSPSYRLDVQGGQINSSGGLCIAGDCKTAWSQVGGSSQWTTSGSHVYYNTGSVGIGTTSPTAKLHVYGTGNIQGIVQSTTAGAELDLISSAGGAGSWGLGTGWATTGLRNLYLYDNVAGATRMLIDSSGNVGIGTTTPAYKLDVIDNNTNAGGFQLTNNTNGSTAQLQNRLVNNAGSLAYYGLTSSGYNQAPILSNRAFFGSNGVDTVVWTQSANNIIFATNGLTTAAERMRIDSSGNVGIGMSPGAQYKLDVNGDVRISGNIAAKYQDVAEWVPTSRALPAGTVVTLDPTKSNHVEASSRAYDTRVAGVISSQPGITLGEQGESKVLVATTGRVKVLVDASNGPIQVGDLLVTSDIPGVAKKSEPLMLGGVPIHRPGTLIGKALEPLAKGRGEILVLLSLQ